MMYDNKVFQHGVEGALVIKWEVECVSPMVVRNGVSYSYQEQSGGKERGQQTAFRWKEKEKKEEKWNEVNGLYFDYEVDGDSVRTFHNIPPSSIRGALRSWTIKHLVDPRFHDSFSPPKNEDGNEDEVDQKEESETSNYLQNVKEALQERRHGYQLIASVFGLAYDTRGENEDVSNAGRLRVFADRFRRSGMKEIKLNGNPDAVNLDQGPSNVKRQMAVRGPVDRITHAAKDGGLHHFLEFCSGETFEVKMVFLNPKESDLGLVSLWQREIEAGMLRFGAMSSNGRGRARLKDVNCNLWNRVGSESRFDVSQFEENETGDDILAGLWKSYKLPVEKMTAFLESLNKELT